MEMRLRPMTRWLARAVLVAGAACALNAWAQSSGSQGNSPQPQPAKVAPSPADLEPGVNTSATQPSSSDTAPAPTPERSAPQTAPKTAKRPSATAPGGTSTATGSSASPAGATPAAAEASPPATARAAAPKSGAPGGKAQDRIELDTTQITGNRELPKVLYIVPWKRSDLGDLVGKPVNSLLDEVLTPVDRDVFKRQNRYYDALKPDAAKDSGGAAAGPEKP